LNAYEKNGEWKFYHFDDNEKVLKFKEGFAIEMEKSCDMSTHTDGWFEAE